MRKNLTKNFWNIDVWAVQKHVNLVDLVKSFPQNIFLQNLASIQKRTSPVEFAHLAEKSGKGSISNISTKRETRGRADAEAQPEPRRKWRVRSPAPTRHLPLCRSGGHRSQHTQALNIHRPASGKRTPIVPQTDGGSYAEPELKGSIGEGPNHSNHSNHSNSFKNSGIFPRKFKNFRKIFNFNIF